MARKKNTLGEVRTKLYQSARILGDVEALARGPEAVGKRIVRRVIGRAFGRAMRKLFR